MKRVKNVLLFAVVAQSVHGAPSPYQPPHAPATKSAYLTLPPGAVEPQGWLRDWCEQGRDFAGLGGRWRRDGRHSGAVWLRQVPGRDIPGNRNGMAGGGRQRTAQAVTGQDAQANRTNPTEKKQ